MNAGDRGAAGSARAGDGEDHATGVDHHPAERGHGEQEQEEQRPDREDLHEAAVFGGEDEKSKSCCVNFFAPNMSSHIFKKSD